MPGNTAPKQAGFSFIELLVSVVIIALLATIAMPLAETTVRRQKEQELKTALREIRQAIDAYKLAANNGKISVRIDQSGYPPTLNDLTKGVEDATRPGNTLYFLRRIPRDPFYPDTNVPASSTWGKRSYLSPADAPKEGEDVFDVYSTSALTGLNGIPYNQW